MEKDSVKEAVEVINTELVFPSHTNHYGTIFGGRVLGLRDMTGVLAAMRFANEEAVTAAIEAVDFKMPIKKGDILELRAKAIYSAKTSMVVKVDVFRVSKFHSRKDFTCRGYLVFVAVDANGEPRPVPKLKTIGEEDEKFWKIGEKIKKRSAERSKMKKDII